VLPPRAVRVLLLVVLTSLAACNEHDLGKPCGSCSDGAKNGDESDVDCGGWCAGCPETCGTAACKCETGYDCASGNCTAGECGPAVQTDGARTATREAVGQSTAYPCESLICVASQGRPGYCSQKCRNDAGCPDGFECREIMNEGEFAGEKFCAWRACNAPADCGNVEELCCSPVPNADPEQDVKLCELANEGTCG
jgi:hypothetical protein